MRIMFVGFVALAMVAADAPAALADNAPYCSTGFGGSFQPTRCDFHTWDQCWATVKGGYGGTCIENPDIAWGRRSGGQDARGGYRQRR
jgi:hypothetical protein